MRSLLLLALVVLPIVGVGLGSPGLIDPDEGRYAEIPREMLESGDFVTPTLNGVVYAEKPPLLYWLVAGSFAAFGQHEWAARAVPAASALLAVWLAYGLGRRMFGERAGLLGAVILSTSLLFAVLSRALVIDMLFTALLGLALAAWWWGRAPRDGRGRRVEQGGARAWLCDAGFWAALALAVLAKGPVALVLVCGTLVLYALLCRERTALTRRSLWLTAPLLPLIAAPWFLAMSARHADFDRFYWFDHHVGRYLGHTPVANYHEHGVLYLVGWLPLLFLPWSLFVPAAIADGRRLLLPATTERRRAALYLLSGAVFVTLFFSVSHGKLLTYVLPAFPPVALCLGAWFDRRLTLDAGTSASASTSTSASAMRWPLPLRVGAMLAAGGLLSGAVTLAWRGPAVLAEREGLAPAVSYSVAALLGLCGACTALALLRRRLAALLGCVAGSMVAAFLALTATMPLVADNHSVRSLVAAIGPGLDAGGRLVTFDGYRPSLCFYARRRVFVNGTLGELRYGMERLPPDERAQWYTQDSRAILAQQLAAPTPVYCLLDDHEAALDLLPALGADVREIAWNTRGSMLGNGAAVALTPPVGRRVRTSQPEALHSIAPPGRK